MRKLIRGATTHQSTVLHHGATFVHLFIFASLPLIKVPCVCPGGLCLHRVAEFPRADRGLPGPQPFLGQQQGALGLHLQVDQRLLHGADWSRHLPQVASMFFLPQRKTLLHRVSPQTTDTASLSREGSVQWGWRQPITATLAINHSLRFNPEVAPPHLSHTHTPRPPKSPAPNFCSVVRGHSALLAWTASFAARWHFQEWHLESVWFEAWDADPVTSALIWTCTVGASANRLLLCTDRVGTRLLVEWPSSFSVVLALLAVN